MLMEAVSKYLGLWNIDQNLALSTMWHSLNNGPQNSILASVLKSFNTMKKRKKVPKSYTKNAFYTYMFT